jgi:hypothetical protein
MYVMSWVGIATTIGLVIEVPILVRSLADSLADVNLDHLPLGFHPSLLAALDDGVGTESPSRLVDSYACDWWRHNREPATGGIFGIDTLDECLDRYRQYIPVPIISHSPPTDDAECRAECRSCIDLRALIRDMFEEARSMHNSIDACESSADAALNANTRQAAGLQRLHELALLKELQAEPRPLSSAAAAAAASKSTPRRVAGPSKPSAVTRQSQLVAGHARAELERLKALPPTSHKWTWGVDITEKDIFASNQKTKGKGKSHHSGYVRSLPHGVCKKEWSITASTPTVSAAYSRPPTVTGIDAGLYFSDDESDDSSGAVSNADSDAAPAPDATTLGHSTASYAAMVWHGADEASNHADLPTASQAAMAWQGDDDEDDDSSPHTGAPTAFDAAAFYPADSSSSSPSANAISTAFPTASDAADVFLSSSETDSAGSHAQSNADAQSDADAESDVEDNSSAESPSTSQIERCTPSRITLPIYSHADFSYIDDTWLPGSDDMMDTTDNE